MPSFQFAQEPCNQSHVWTVYLTTTTSSEYNQQFTITVPATVIDMLPRWVRLRKYRQWATSNTDDSNFRNVEISLTLPTQDITVSDYSSDALPPGEGGGIVRYVSFSAFCGGPTVASDPPSVWKFLNYQLKSQINVTVQSTPGATGGTPAVSTLQLDFEFTDTQEIPYF